MEEHFKFWKIRDKTRLLLALMDELAGDANVSFEGDLQRTTLFDIPGASEEPTAILKRNTLWPQQDFVIVPLGPSMSSKIITAIGGTVPGKIIHIQIEKDGQLQFGAYDNFHPECIYFGSAVTEAVIERLISQDVMRPYTKRRPARKQKS